MSYQGQSVALVIPAAGMGTRLGMGTPKAFVDIAGVSILRRAVEGALDSEYIDSIIVVVAADMIDAARSLVGQAPTVSITAGGQERSDSVRCGLNKCAEADIVLVHDAARCFTPVELFDTVIDHVASGYKAVIPGLDVVDTIKTVDRSGNLPVVVDTPPRAHLVAVQTPQGFHGATLRAAHRSGLDATDDAALVEQTGTEVYVVPGMPRARKITTAEDLETVSRWV